QRGAFAIEFFAAMRARLAAAQAEGRKPSPGLGLVMGEDARTKMANLVAALEGGILAPVELLLRLG
ncbi:MAG: SAM-dependent methyltransferase, partial [Mesorhizobium sp.]